MIALRLPLTIACASLIAWAGCATWPAVVEKPQEKPDAAAPLPASPSTAPSTQPRPALTLAQLLGEVAASDEQRAQIKQMIEQSQQAWRAWWTAHRPQLEQLRDEAKQAADAKDRPNLERIQKEQHALTQAARQSNNVTWDAVKRILTPEQQVKLAALERQGPLPSLWTVHQAVREGRDRHMPPGAAACTPCHMPYYGR